MCKYHAAASVALGRNALWIRSPTLGCVDVSPFLRGLPEPARTSADHCLTLARDVLEPGTFLSYRGERVKPALDFQVFTEAWAVEVFNVVVADRELGPSGGDRAPGQGFPTCVVQ